MKTFWLSVGEIIGKLSCKHHIRPAADPGGVASTSIGKGKARRISPSVTYFSESSVPLRWLILVLAT